MKQIEKYVTFDKIKADYIVLTYNESKTVKFIKKDTQEVIAIVLYTPLENREYKLKKTLKEMGIPIAEPIKTKQRLPAGQRAGY